MPVSIVQFSLSSLVVCSFAKLEAGESEEGLNGGEGAVGK